MAKEFHRPVVVDGAWMEYFSSGHSPEDTLDLAHKSAWLLIDRMRSQQQHAEQFYARLLSYIDSHGIDDLAEIWSHAPHPSLPAALWRIYLVRQLTVKDPTHLSLVYRYGLEGIDTSDIAVVGAQDPTGPNEILQLSEQILRGVFTGDFAVALNRAAAFCRICSVGYTQLADSSETANAQRASAFTTRAFRLSEIAVELSQAAELWHDKRLA